MNHNACYAMIHHAYIKGRREGGRRRADDGALLRLRHPEGGVRLGARAAAAAGARLLHEVRHAGRAGHGQAARHPREGRDAGNDDA